MQATSKLIIRADITLLYCFIYSYMSHITSLLQQHGPRH